MTTAIIILYLLFVMCLWLFVLSRQAWEEQAVEISTLKMRVAFLVAQHEATVQTYTSPWVDRPKKDFDSSWGENLN